MIASENLVPVSIVLTERKLKMCKLIQDLLKNQGITKSEDEIVNIVKELKNSDFLTEYEQITQTISGKNFQIEKILSQQPHVKIFIEERLFN